MQVVFTVQAEQDLEEIGDYYAWPQVLQENKSSGIGGMFSKPLSHFLIGPSPFKRMGI